MERPNELRGSMDDSRYKDYMLGLMFLNSNSICIPFDVSSGSEIKRVQMPEARIIKVIKGGWWIQMIEPGNVRKEANKKDNENMRFRTYLKCHANEKELDRQFLDLHNELFKGYDCSRCRNCCKMYRATIPAEDIERAAEYLELTQEQFINTFLQENELGTGYETKHMPCDFLNADGECILGEVRPDNCKNYPYTNQPERLFSLYSVLEAAGVCPVAFEIYERLKKEYGFPRKREKTTRL